MTFGPRTYLCCTSTLCWTNFRCTCSFAMADAQVMIYGEPPSEPSSLLLSRLFREHHLFLFCEFLDAARLCSVCVVCKKRLGGKWERQRLDVFRTATSVFWSCSPSLRSTYLGMPFAGLKCHVELWAAHGRDIPADMDPAVLAIMGRVTAPQPLATPRAIMPKAPPSGWLTTLTCNRRTAVLTHLKGEATQLAYALLQGAAGAMPTPGQAPAHPPCKAPPRPSPVPRDTFAAMPRPWPNTGESSAPPTRPDQDSATSAASTGGVQMSDSPAVLAANAWATVPAKAPPDVATRAAAPVRTQTAVPLAGPPQPAPEVAAPTAASSICPAAPARKHSDEWGVPPGGGRNDGSSERSRQR